MLQVLDLGVERAHLRLETATGGALVGEHLIEGFEGYVGVGGYEGRRLDGGIWRSGGGGCWGG